MKNTYIGPWEDTANSAVNRAAEHVGISEWLKSETLSGFIYFNYDDTARVYVDVVFSEERQQYKAKLNRVQLTKEQ